MEAEQIHIDDFKRILFGDVPAEFFVEVVLRVVIIYLVLMVSMRLMGKRMASQLSRNEFAAMVSLAAAIGIPIQSPDRGLLPAVIIAGIIVGFQFFLSKRATKSKKFEQISQGDYSILVENAVMDLNSMKETRISRDRLFSKLRNEGFTNLGKVERVYLEASGSFTVLSKKEARPGLVILPEWDTDFIDERCEKTDRFVCHRCGNLPEEAAQPDRTDKCSHCGGSEWAKAVL